MEKQTGFSWRNLKERVDMENIGAAEIVILQWMWSDQNGKARRRVIWLRKLTFVVSCKGTILDQLKKLSASKEGLCSMYLVG